MWWSVIPDYVDKIKEFNASFDKLVAIAEEGIRFSTTFYLINKIKKPARNILIKKFLPKESAGVRDEMLIL